MYFEQFHFQTKKILTAQIATGPQRFWKMSTAQHNYRKENGVHVRQLGQVLGQVRLYQVRFGQVRLGQVRLGKVRKGQVKQGRIGHEQVRQIKLLTISIGNKIDFFSLYVALERSVNCSTVLTSCHFFVNWSNPVEPGLTRFEQLKNFVLSS